MASRPAKRPKAAVRPGSYVMRLHLEISLDDSTALRLYSGVIRPFADANTESVWMGRRVSFLPLDVQTVGRRKLRMINSARDQRDLRSPPGNRLELLKGDRAGQYSVRINRQWGVCFRWRSGDAHDVQIVDYHG